MQAQILYDCVSHCILGDWKYYFPLPNAHLSAIFTTLNTDKQIVKSYCQSKTNIPFHSKPDSHSIK